MDRVLVLANAKTWLGEWMKELLTEISKNEVLRYLGYQGGELPTYIEETIDEAMLEVMKISVPRYVAWVFDIAHGVALKGTSFMMEGEDIKTHLMESDKCILMAATLGAEIETMLRKTQITDMARAVILDSCASSAIENICDNLEGYFAKEWAEKGCFLTERFSPGYGDMPIAQQKEFCNLLDTQRKIGLCVNDTGILIPRKSVTAVLGIAKKPQPRRFKGCDLCNLFETCNIRKKGNTCGK